MKETLKLYFRYFIVGAAFTTGSVVALVAMLFLTLVFYFSSVDNPYHGPLNPPVERSD